MFFDDVRLPLDNLIGVESNGWAVAWALCCMSATRSATLATATSRADRGWRRIRLTLRQLTCCRFPANEAWTTCWPSASQMAT